MRSGATALRLHPYPTPGLRERAATETAPETGARTGLLAGRPATGRDGPAPARARSHDLLPGAVVGGDPGARADALA